MTRMTTEQMMSVRGGKFFDGFLCGAGVVGLLALGLGTGGVAMGATALFFTRLGVAGLCYSALR